MLHEVFIEKAKTYYRARFAELFEEKNTNEVRKLGNELAKDAFRGYVYSVAEKIISVFGNKTASSISELINSLVMVGRSILRKIGDDVSDFAEIYGLPLRAIEEMLSPEADPKSIAQFVTHSNPPDFLSEDEVVLTKLTSLLYDIIGAIEEDAFTHQDYRELMGTPIGTEDLVTYGMNTVWTMLWVAGLKYTNIGEDIKEKVFAYLISSAL